MSFSIGGSVLQTVLDIGSQIVNNIERKNAAYDERIWNTPANQVARLQQAGLNPYALAPQVAANNTSDAFAAGVLDAGGSVGRAVDSYNKSEQVRMQREVNDIQLKVMREQLNGIQLDNAYKSRSLEDRVGLANMKFKLAQLDSSYRSGLITEQEYRIQRDKIQTDWQLYNAGLWSDTFGDPSSTFEGGDTAPMVANNNAEYRNKDASANLKDLEFQIKQDMRFFIEKEIKFSSLKTEREWKILGEKLIRETVAAAYEKSTNMPFNDRNPWIHIAEAISSRTGEIMRGENVGFGKATVYAICDYLGIPRPGKRQKKSQGGAGGKF